MKKITIESIEKIKKFGSSFYVICFAWAIAFSTSIFLASYFSYGVILLPFFLVIFNTGLYMLIFKLVNLNYLDFSSFYVGLRHPLVTTFHQYRLHLKSLLLSLLFFFFTLLIAVFIFFITTSILYPDFMNLIKQSPNDVNLVYEYINSNSNLSNAYYLISYGCAYLSFIFFLLSKSKNGFALFITFELPVLFNDTIRYSNLIYRKEKSNVKKLNSIAILSLIVCTAISLGILYLLTRFINIISATYLCLFIFSLLIAPFYIFYIVSKISIYNCNKYIVLEEFKRSTKIEITNIDPEEFEKQIKKLVERGVITPKQATDLIAMNRQIKKPDEETETSDDNQ